MSFQNIFQAILITLQKLYSLHIWLHLKKKGQKKFLHMSLQNDQTDKVLYLFDSCKIIV